MKYCQIHKIQLKGKRIRSKKQAWVSLAVSLQNNLQVKLWMRCKLQSPIRKWKWSIGGMSVAYRSTCWPTIGLPLSVDISVGTRPVCRPIRRSSVGRYVDRYIGWGVHKIHMIQKNFKRLENLIVSKGFRPLSSSFANHKTGHARVILMQAIKNDINVHKQTEIFWDSRITLSLSFASI